MTTETTDTVRDQAIAQLENIQALVSRLEHAQQCDGDPDAGIEKRPYECSLTNGDFLDFFGEPPMSLRIFTTEERQEYHDEDKLEPLLETTFSGMADGFAVADWSEADRHLVSYLRPLGKGAVLYNTLGHCRSHYDMAPVLDYYPSIERCSWEHEAYYELLRRSIRWARGQTA